MPTDSSFLKKITTRAGESEPELEPRVIKPASFEKAGAGTRVKFLIFCREFELEASKFLLVPAPCNIFFYT